MNDEGFIMATGRQYCSHLILSKGQSRQLFDLQPVVIVKDIGDVLRRIHSTTLSPLPVECAQNDYIQSCPLCEDKFSSLKSLKSHIKRCHDVIVTSHRCPLCHKLRERRIIKHMINCAARGKTTTVSPSRSPCNTAAMLSVESSSEIEGNQYTCDVYSTAHSTTNSTAKHGDIITDITACPFCSGTVAGELSSHACPTQTPQPVEQPVKQTVEQTVEQTVKHTVEQTESPGITQSSEPKSRSIYRCAKCRMQFNNLIAIQTHLRAKHNIVDLELEKRIADMGIQLDPPEPPRKTPKLRTDPNISEFIESQFDFTRPVTESSSDSEDSDVDGSTSVAISLPTPPRTEEGEPPLLASGSEPSKPVFFPGEVIDLTEGDDDDGLDSKSVLTKRKTKHTPGSKSPYVKCLCCPFCVFGTDNSDEFMHHLRMHIYPTSSPTCPLCNFRGYNYLQVKSHCTYVHKKIMTDTYKKSRKAFKTSLAKVSNSKRTDSPANSLLETIETVGTICSDTVSSMAKAGTDIQSPLAYPSVTQSASSLHPSLHQVVLKGQQPLQSSECNGLQPVPVDCTFMLPGLKSIKCDVCHHISRTPGSHYQHLLAFHREIFKAYLQRRFQFEQSKPAHSSSAELDSRVKERQMSLSQSAQPQHYPRMPVTEPTVFLQCPQCSYTTYHSQELSSHIETVHTVLLNCPNCDYVSLFQNEMAEHKKIHIRKH